MWKALESGWTPPPESVGKDGVRCLSGLDKENKYPKHLVGWVGINCSYSGGNGLVGMLARHKQKEE